MEKIKPPRELDMDSRNLAETWREWQESWELYEISSGLSKKDEKVQVATLLSVIGVKARRVLKTLPNIPENLEDRRVKDTLKALKDYCMLRTNVTYERYVFRTTTQDDRAFDVFLTELRHKAILCEFGDIKDSLIRDQIVIGTNNPALRERLLREPDLTLTKTINLCRASEQAIEQSKLIAKPDRIQENEVDSVQASARPSRYNTKSLVNCRFCGLQHDRGNCKAYNATCHRCKEKHHFARCCSKKLPQRTTAKSVRGVELKQDPPHYNSEEMCKEVESLYIEAVTSSKKKCIEQELIVGNKPVIFKLDTGAECHVLPETIAKELIDCQIEPTNTTLRSFGGNPLNTVGKCLVNTYVHGHMSPNLVEYYVVSHDVKPILGIESCL